MTDEAKRDEQKYAESIMARFLDEMRTADNEVAANEVVLARVRTARRKLKGATEARQAKFERDGLKLAPLPWTKAAKADAEDEGAEGT